VLAELLVEGAERFVHEQNTWLKDQRTRERDTLLLSSGELTRHVAVVIAQSNETQRFLYHFCAFAFGQAAHTQWKLDVGRDRHVRKERIVLEHDAEATLVSGRSRDIGAVNRDPTGISTRETSDDHERGGFPRSTRAQKRQKLAFADIETDVVKNRYVSV
jgi:hypothetical protein